MIAIPKLRVGKNDSTPFSLTLVAPPSEKSKNCFFFLYGSHTQIKNKKQRFSRTIQQKDSDKFFDAAAPPSAK